MITNNNALYNLVDFNFLGYFYKLLVAMHIDEVPITLQGEQLAIGAKYQKAGHIQQAKIIYSKILKVDPTCASARHRLGVILFLDGDTKGALRLIDSALILQPDNAIFYMSLSKVLHLENRSKEADSILRRGIIGLLNTRARSSCETLK